MAVTDEQILSLIAKVDQQKSEIAKIEKPRWKTNCQFRYNEEDMNKTIILHTESNVQKLIMMAAFVREKQAGYYEAASVLGVESPPKFTWCNQPPEDWIADITLRIQKLEISTRRKKLEDLETRLNAIISPELKAEMEMRAIEAALN